MFCVCLYVKTSLLRIHISCENEFSQQVYFLINQTHFHMNLICARSRFETEAQGNKSTEKSHLNKNWKLA